MSTLPSAVLGDHEHTVFQRDGFACVYCGFDGNGFNQWRQLAVDHLRPNSAGGTDAPDNLVTACNSCMSATNGMKFPQDQSSEEIFTLKKKRIQARLKELSRFWSDKVAPRDTALTPEQGGAYLPYPLVLDLQAIDMTDDQLLKISDQNGDLQIELTEKGELVVMPPTGGDTGWLENALCFRLTQWALQDDSGVPFGQSTGFRLPNGALRAPDAAWIARERWEALTAAERKTFPPACPDFVLELRSESDTLASVQRKMEEYIENGARLGWLVDPIQKQVHVYRPDTSVEVLDNPATVSGEPVLPGFELNLQEIW